MVRRISTSQLRSQLRQLENKQRQAISRYNQEVRRHNQHVRSAVSQYNSAVRQYNSRLRANRQRAILELNKMQGRTIVRYQALHESTVSLNRSYESLENKECEFENIPFGNQFLDLSENENANSLAALNALETAEPKSSSANDEDLVSTSITSELCSISTDLDSRWKGALFSLSPRNPDASRHFCTSAREIFVQILDHFAPDDSVLLRFPECDKSENGNPTRRWKINYILHNSGITSVSAIDFVDEDIANVLKLFRVFNDGTHGSAGRFEFAQLRTMKERVESGIIYLTTICRNA
jgi:hypothetical protein